MKKLFLFLFLSLNCAPFRNSPFSDQVLHRERSWNEASLEKLSEIDADGVLRIAIFSDVHQNYADMDRIVMQINGTEAVDFVVHLGDMTNQGYNFEYDQFFDSWLEMERPALAVIGNHDAIGAGLEIFTKLFGRMNFWFESNSRRFIFFHSNNLEDPAGFDSAWLRAAVEASPKPVIIWTHIPLKDRERFSGSVAADFEAVIRNPKTDLIVNGHNHVFHLSRESGTILLQSPRAEGVQWLLLEIRGVQLQIERRGEEGIFWETLKN